MPPGWISPLRRAGDSVILEGRADLTSLTDPDADVSLSVSFPGDVTSTNGDQVDSQVVEWKLKPGVVTTMTAQARYTDPSARSFTGAAVWMGLAALVVAALIGSLAMGQPRPLPSVRRTDTTPGIHSERGRRAERRSRRTVGAAVGRRGHRPAARVHRARVAATPVTSAPTMAR